MFNYYEFFAGGGMVRAGLGSKWNCAFANDIDPLKAETYRKNWGSKEFSMKDVHDLESSDLPGRVDLAWASFPCQDVSCAGNGLGIGPKSGALRTRSGTFWQFIKLMRGLKKRNRAPRLIVIENVLGLLSGNSGADFRSVASALASLDYRFGAVVVDARYFVPQSRPRVFIVAVSGSRKIDQNLQSHGPISPWHSDLVVRAWRSLPPKSARQWIWFDPGEIRSSRKRLADVVSGLTKETEWHSKRQTNRLISLMSEVHKKKLLQAKKSKQKMVATLFLRMRPESGINRQRAEISFNEVAGCIRTPKGGGSRVRILSVKGDDVRTRLLSPREAAILMGLKKTYKLPMGYDAAFKVLGDGVAAPAVAFVRDRILEPLLQPKGTGPVSRKPTQRGSARA